MMNNDASKQLPVKSFSKTNSEYQIFAVNHLYLFNAIIVMM